MVLGELEGRIRNRVRKAFLGTVPKYYGHTMKVVAKMKSLLSEVPEPQEKLILLLAAYLHDIGYSVRYRGQYVGYTLRQSLKVRLHSELGAQLARELLEGEGVETEVVATVSYLVSVHHRSDLEDSRLKILFAADST